MARWSEYTVRTLHALPPIRPYLDVVLHVLNGHYFNVECMNDMNVMALGPGRRRAATMRSIATNKL